MGVLTREIGKAAKGVSAVEQATASTITKAAGKKKADAVLQQTIEQGKKKPPPPKKSQKELKALEASGIDAYYEQAERGSLNVLRYALTEGVDKFAFTVGGASGYGPRRDLELSYLNKMAGVSEENRQYLRTTQREGNARRFAADYDLYKQMRAEMGAAAFDAEFKGQGITHRDLYGDTGEFADYTVLTSRVEAYATHARGAPHKDVPALVGPSEGGLHTGDALTAVNFQAKAIGRRDLYESAKKALKRKDLSPAQRAQYEFEVEEYEENVRNAQAMLHNAIMSYVPGFDEVDAKAVERGLAELAEEWYKLGTDFEVKAWWRSDAAKEKVLKELTEELGIGEDEASAIMREAAVYHKLMAKSSAETRMFYLKGFKKPLVIHDLNYSSVEHIAEFISEYPEFERYSEELLSINSRIPQELDSNQRLKMKSEMLFEIIGREGYDVIAYLNQGEGTEGGRSVSWILPTTDTERFPNIRDVAPKTAKKNNLLTVAAVMAPAWAAMQVKKAEAQEAPPTPVTAAGEDGDLYEEEGVIYKKEGDVYRRLGTL